MRLRTPGYAWTREFTEANSRPAIYALKGDVYVGLDALTLSADDVDCAQGHLRMLSGLYGLLRPLDRMQPYRLEMGTRLAVRLSKNLCDFWDKKITEALMGCSPSRKTRFPPGIPRLSRSV